MAAYFAEGNMHQDVFYINSKNQLSGPVLKVTNILLD